MLLALLSVSAASWCGRPVAPWSLSRVPLATVTSRSSTAATSASAAARRRAPSQCRMDAAEQLDASVPASEKAMINAIGGSSAATYGEITALGFAQLAHRLKLGPDDVFADLGSGTGKTVLQAASEFGASRAWGVELSPSRHASAMMARNELHHIDPHASQRVILLEGDAAGDEGKRALEEARDFHVFSRFFSFFSLPPISFSPYVTHPFFPYLSRFIRFSFFFSRFFLFFSLPPIAFSPYVTHPYFSYLSLLFFFSRRPSCGFRISYSVTN